MGISFVLTTAEVLSHLGGGPKKTYGSQTTMVGEYMIGQRLPVSLLEYSSG